MKNFFKYFYQAFIFSANFFKILYENIKNNSLLIFKIAVKILKNLYYFFKQFIQIIIIIYYVISFILIIIYIFFFLWSVYMGNFNLINNVIDMLWSVEIFWAIFFFLFTIYYIDIMLKYEYNIKGFFWFFLFLLFIFLFIIILEIKWFQFMTIYNAQRNMSNGERVYLFIEFYDAYLASWHRTFDPSNIDAQMYPWVLSPKLAYLIYYIDPYIYHIEYLFYAEGANNATNCYFLQHGWTSNYYVNDKYILFSHLSRYDVIYIDLIVDFLEECKSVEGLDTVNTEVYFKWLDRHLICENINGVNHIKYIKS
jgi:hypothetical protein